MGWRTKEQAREYHKKYYNEHKEKHNEYAREWCKKNPEKRREISRNWGRKNKGTTPESLAKSCTWKGRKAEFIALKMLEGSIDLNKNGMNQDYDILWNGKTVDVKSHELYKRKNKRGKPVKGKQTGVWSFGKGKNTADYYFCICLVEHIPTKFYLIPKEYFGNGICIGEKTKYERFKF